MAIDTKGLRLSHLAQLHSYLEDREREGWYYGNREQFERRHEELKEWLNELIETKRGNLK